MESKLIEEAAKRGIVNIKGHTANPGIRVSMYNAMPLQGMVVLCKFLDDFRKANPLGLALQQTSGIINNARL